MNQAAQQALHRNNKLAKEWTERAEAAHKKAVRNVRDRYGFLYESPDDNEAWERATMNALYFEGVANYIAHNKRTPSRDEISRIRKSASSLAEVICQGVPVNVARS